MRRDVRARLRYRHGDPAAPFDVLAKASAESLVVREPDLVGRFEEYVHESPALGFRDRTIRVMT